MGRPPLNVVETKVRLTPETRERIEAIVGPNQMAAFIRDAVENELTRRGSSKAASTRFTVITNDEWWSVWDTKKNKFGRYKGSWLMSCGMDEAYRLAKVLNEENE